MTATQRARIDSVEKVAEWVGMVSSSVSVSVSVSRSPVVLSGTICAPPRSGRQAHRRPHHHQRRNSSPRNRSAKNEFVEAVRRGLRKGGCALDPFDDSESESEPFDEERGRGEKLLGVVGVEENVRGRRRAEELDEPAARVGDAPGLGSGRSGLRARSARERVQAVGGDGW